jgi:hypothetical protein
MRKAWAGLLFVDERPPLATDPVAGDEGSDTARRKASTRKSARGDTCHSFQSLIAELALTVRNTDRFRGRKATFDTVTDPNRTQARARTARTHPPARVATNQTAKNGAKHLPEPKARVLRGVASTYPVSALRGLWSRAVHDTASLRPIA